MLHKFKKKGRSLEVGMSIRHSRRVQSLTNTGEFASEGPKTASDGDNKRPGTAPDGVRCVVCEPLENWMKSFRKKVKEDNGEPGELEFPICLWHRGQKSVVHARMVETLVEIKKMDFGRKIRLGVTGTRFEK